MTDKKLVYSFDEVENANSQEMIFLLGNKGAQLAEMTASKLPVPQGFTITTEACNKFYDEGKKWPHGLEGQVKEKLEKLEKLMGKKLGGKEDPLFVSVRSGSYVSMPGMMDTVLNLGMNDESVEAFAKKTGNERAALDSYRRFITMFGDVVMDVKHSLFEEILDNAKDTKGVKFDTDLDAADLKELIPKYKALVRKEAGKDFPQDPWEQLKMSIDAVFNSWNTPRAVSYRRINSLRSDAGTGVNVQAMVFGNMGEDSGTGASFTRNPANGDKEHYGEFLINAQGEDVVAGIRTPRPVDELKEVMPDVYEELLVIYDKLENHYKDLQDFEFTIEDKKLYLLQTRNGKRTAQAAVKIAVDMEKEGLLSKEEAILKVKPEQLDQLLHKQLDPIAKKESEALTKGLPASPGAAVGKVVFTAEKAKEMHDADHKEKLILVRTETSPEDIEGMNVAQGILTARGGMTCVGKDSLLLTDKGFFTAEQLFEAMENDLKPKILSFDSNAMKSKWKNVIAAGRRESDTIEVDVSQTGRAKGNSLVITPDHKMMLINDRKLEKKPLKSVLDNQEFVSVLDKVPFSPGLDDPDYAYLAGAIFTDGYLALSPRRGNVTFTQKGTDEKFDFIRKVNLLFFKKFDIQMRERIKSTVSRFENRQIVGDAFDYVCSRQGPTQTLLQTEQNVAQWVMALDEQSTLSFLAGVVDGDGCFADNKLQIYIGKENLLSGVVVACLKLGIVPQVTTNRSIYNVQIVEKVDEICRFTARVKSKPRPKKYESKLFSCRQLFGDVKSGVDFTGRIKPAIRDNKMLGVQKIKNYILKYKQLDKNLKKDIERVLDSDLRMYRVKKINDCGKQTVYNFEVDSANELDKNFVVFTKRFTPLLVSNSHAAVVARGMGKCCVAGAGDITVNEKEGFFTIKGLKIGEGDWVSLDGGTGELFQGQIPLVEPSMLGDFDTLMKWADSFKKLRVKTNADNPKDAKIALDFGAEGIGLVRTEHMFFEGDRIKAVREMILAENLEGRKKALDKLLPYQKEDFSGIFEVMDKLPVIIRLLDPPLHEFLPKEEKDMQSLAEELGFSLDKVKQITESLHEFNPMLGFRGCRLGMVYPEINAMQAKAIFQAALEVQGKGIKPLPWIEVPLVGNVKEFLKIREIIERVAEETGAKGKVDYKIGTMIEVPRAALTADLIAKEAEFISFGTNDLTQMTCGFSRDDAAKFLKPYVEELGVYDRDPFQAIDQSGVGLLMELCVEKARKANPKIEIGICGEHGGEPQSVEFCHKIGLNDVSCSPFRVPIARLAAAQAAIKENNAKKPAEEKQGKKE